MMRLLALLLLMGCSSELIGPEHADYQDLCTLYVWEDGWVDITRDQIEGCYSIRLMVMKWEN